MTYARTPHEAVGLAAARAVMACTAALHKEAQPVTYGAMMRYRAMVPRKDADAILADNDCPYWFMYAEALREYKALLDATTYVPFQEKGKKK